MKVTYKSENGRMIFEIEAATRKAAFHQIAALQELFEEPLCGCCMSPDIRFEVAKRSGYEFMEYRCTKCNAQLDIGETKEGVLWVKRWDKQAKQPLPNRGWHIYQSTGGGGSSSDSQESAPGRSATDTSDIPF